MPSLIATLGANIAPFTRGLDEAKGKAKGAGGEISGSLGDKLTDKLGAMVAGAATISAGMAIAELGSHITDLSNRLGISTDAVQQWDFALKQNGSSIDSAVGFFERLAVARQKALDGSQTQIVAFQRLGLSLAQLKSMRVEDIAAAIARTVQSSDPEQIIGPLRDIGGRAAGELIPAFREGLADALGEAPIISAADIAVLDRAADSFTALKTEATAAFAPLVAAISEMLLMVKDVAENLVALPVGAINALAENFRKLDTSSIGGFVKTFGNLVDPHKILGGAKEGFDAMREAHANRDAAAETRRARLQTRTGPLDLEGEGNRQEKAKLDALDKQIFAEARKRALEAMSAAERKSALQEEIDFLRKKEAAETDAFKKKELQLEVLKREKEFDTELEKQRKDKERDDKAASKDAMRAKGREFEVNALQRVGGFLGSMAAAPELAMLDVQKKSEQHLASIKKGIDKLNAPGSTSSDDTEF